MKSKKPIKKISKTPAKELKQLGNRIKTIRIAMGYRNYEIFAYENNLPRAQYGRYENGTSDMQFTSLLKVVKAFNMTLEEFFSEGFDD